MYKALIIAVDQYEKVSHLPNTVNDAREIKRLLLEFPSLFKEQDVQIFHGSISKKVILQATLNSFFQGASNSDVLFLFWAGHGAIINGQGYFVPYDGDVQSVENSMIPMHAVKELIDQTSANTVLSFFDTCHSGAVTRMIQNEMTRGLEVKGSGKVLIAACTESQGAWDRSGHGAFTDYLIRGLEGEASDLNGDVDVYNLYSYISKKLDEEFKNQDPVIKSTLNGKPLLLKRVVNRGQEIENLGTLGNPKKESIVVENKRMDNTIFILYSRMDKDKIEILEKRLISYGFKVIRYEKNINYRKSIKEFMKQIRENDYALIFISESYLKSRNCMFEILEFVKDENYKERVVPIIDESVDILKAVDKLPYIKYWQDEFKNLENELEGIDQLNKVEVLSELKILEGICRTIGEFLDVIFNMEVIRIENMLGISEEYIKDLVTLLGVSYGDDQYYILSKTKTIGFKKNTFIWWTANSSGYTENLKEAGIYSKDELENIIYPYSNYIKNTKSLAIPINIAKLIFHEERTPYSEYYLHKLRENRELIKGDLNWVLPEEIF